MMLSPSRDKNTEGSTTPSLQNGSSTGFSKIFILILVFNLACHVTSGQTLDNTSPSNSTELDITVDDIAESRHQDRRVSRQARLPFGPPNVCHVTAEELDGLINAMKTSNLISVENYHTTLSQSSSSQCRQTIREIKTLVAELKETIVTLSNSTVLKSVHDSALRDRERLEQELNKTIENLGRSLNQTYALKIDELNQSYQLLINKTNANLTMVANELEHYRNTHAQDRKKILEQTVRLCISEIDSGNIASAVNEFANVNDDNELGNIVEGAYRDDVDKVDKILMFARGLATYASSLIVHEALFEKMKASDFLERPAIIVLDYRIEEYLKNSSVPQNYKRRLLEVKGKLEPALNAVWNPMVSNIRRNWLSSAFDQIKQSYNLTSTFNTIFYIKLITRVYENDNSNFHIIIDLIEKLAPWTSVGFGYVYLYDEMQVRGHLDTPELIRLAWKVKQSMDVKSTQQLKQLKARFPEGVRNLLWDIYVYIESRKHPGYTLYFYVFASWGGNLHIYPSNNHQDDGWRQQWKFLPVDDGRRFAISRRADSLVCKSGGSTKLGMYDKSQMRPHCFWTVAPTEGGTYFHMRNQESGRTLGVPDALETCSSSRLCCCADANAVESYNNLFKQQWKIY